MIARAWALAPEYAFRHQDFRRDCVCYKQPKPVLFENRGYSLEQVIVAATEDAENSRQEPQCLEIRSDLLDGRPHHRADENDVPAALPVCNPAKRAELAHRGPVMGITRNPLWLCPTANREKHDTPSAPAYRVGDREWQASPAADDRQRTVICGLAGRRLGHTSSPVEARRIAIVSGREPARMKAITLPTSGSAPLCAAT